MGRHLKPFTRAVARRTTSLASSQLANSEVLALAEASQEGAFSRSKPDENDILDFVSKLNALAIWVHETISNEQLVLLRLIAFALSHGLGQRRLWPAGQVDGTAGLPQLRKYPCVPALTLRAKVKSREYDVRSDASQAAIN